MPNTPGGAPYPASTAAPNVPADIQALALFTDPTTKPAHAAFIKNTPTNPQSLATSTTVKLTSWQAEEAHDEITESNGTFTVTRAGIYLVCASIQYDSGSTGSRSLNLSASGVGRISQAIAAASAGNTWITSARPMRLTAGGTIELSGRHTQGANLAVLNGIGTFITITRMGS